MRFLVDECTGPAVARWLATTGHVFRLYQAAGTTDDEVLSKAFNEDRILITNDRDFGELIFRERRPHKGVIFLRLTDERSANKIAILAKILSNHQDRLSGSFVTATENRIRFG